MSNEQETLPAVPVKRTRGRPTNAEVMTRADDVDQLQREADEALHLQQVDRLYGDDVPFDQHRVEDEVKFYLSQSAQAYFEAGRRLIRLKEYVGYGKFLESLVRIGLSETVAQQTMYTTRKLTEASWSNPRTSGALGASKLYEIALLETEQIEALADGKTIGKVGLSLDAIDRMTVREVREALRREREDRGRRDADREGVIRAKNDKIDELERDLRGKPDWTPREKAGVQLTDIQKRFLTVSWEIKASIRNLDSLLSWAARTNGVELDQLRQWVSEVVDLGTTAVIEDWEAMTSRLDNLVPVAPDV